jgi:hypothetical protein
MPDESILCCSCPPGTCEPFRDPVIYLFEYGAGCFARPAQGGVYKKFRCKKSEEPEAPSESLVPAV